MVSTSRPAPRPQAIEAMAFSTWNEMVPLRVIGIPASGTKLAAAFGGHDGHRLRRTPPWPCTRWVASTWLLGSGARSNCRTRAGAGHLDDHRVGRVEHRGAVGRHVLDDDALHHRQVLHRTDVGQPQVVAHADVGDHRHVAAVRGEALAQHAYRGRSRTPRRPRRGAAGCCGRCANCSRRCRCAACPCAAVELVVPGGCPPRRAGGR